MTQRRIRIKDDGDRGQRRGQDLPPRRRRYQRWTHPRPPRLERPRDRDGFIYPHGLRPDGGDSVNRDLGFPEGHPFHDAEVMSLYTSEQAVEDGIKIRLGARLWCTTNFACMVASKWFVKRNRATVAGPFDTDAEAMHALHKLQPQSAEWAMKYDGYAIEHDVDDGTLRRIVSSIVSEYVAGAYAVPKRADQYGEADAGLATYLVKQGRGLVDEGATPSQQEVKVWAIGDREGLHIMLPDDY